MSKWLSRIATSINKSPAEKVIIMGPPGVGKTSAGCSYPKSVVIQAEHGLVALPDQPSYPALESWEDFEGQLSEADELAEKKKFPHATIVIDTIDALEELCWRYTCSHNPSGKTWPSIEAAGYGKGERATTRTWRRAFPILNSLHNNGINIVIVAHTTVTTFKNPEDADYDRYEMKLHKYARALFFEWASDVYFMRVDSAASKNVDLSVAGGKVKVLGQTGSKRFAHTMWDAAYDAKHRIRLPPKIEVPDPMKGSFYDAMLAARKDAAKLLAEERLVEAAPEE